jgi:multidrug resistance protein MdtO
MGAIAQSLSGATGRFTWLWEFLRQELAPYRGRASLVTRMVTASTLTMIIGVTFQSLYRVCCHICARSIARKSLGNCQGGRCISRGLGAGGRIRSRRSNGGSR